MHVEVFSDIACPWCYVGKRRFERALAGFEHRERVEIVWRSFQLDPTAPAEREGDYVAMLARKYGRTREEAEAMVASMVETGAEEGIEFRFDLQRGANTLDGHRLMHLAAQHGLQHQAKERLMRAYLCEGELLSDPETLRRLGLEIGLDADSLQELIATDLYADRVAAERELAAGFGISAVPFFVVERQFGGAGAQPVEVFSGLLEQAWERTTTA